MTTPLPVFGVGRDQRHALRAGCALGDLIAEWLLFAVGVTIAGVALWPEYIADFALALIFGIAFQYFAITAMRRLSVRDGVIAALKSDTLSVITFEVGLFGWMALMFFVFFRNPHLGPDHAAYWFLMQVGMILGFLTSFPANRWLITRGIKEGSDTPLAANGPTSTRPKSAQATAASSAASWWRWSSSRLARTSVTVR